MSEYRIAYNIFEKHYISGTQSHTIQLYNAKKQKQFNEYIRGIIVDNTLYLRLYYPFDDIDNISINKLNQSSFELLKEHTSDIIKRIKENDNINIKEVKYNYSNDLFEQLKLVNI